MLAKSFVFYISTVLRKCAFEKEGNRIHLVVCSFVRVHVFVGFAVCRLKRSCDLLAKWRVACPGAANTFISKRRKAIKGDKILSISFSRKKGILCDSLFAAAPPPSPATEEQDIVCVCTTHRHQTQF